LAQDTYLVNHIGVSATLSAFTVRQRKRDMKKICHKKVLGKRTDGRTSGQTDRPASKYVDRRTDWHL